MLTAKWLLFSFFSLPLFAASMTLVNDSNYPLIGEIFNAMGQKEGSVRLFPGQTYIWYRDESPFKMQYDRPTTPFTVRFLCTKSRPFDYNAPPKAKEKRASYQSEFGSWDNVPTGATVNAQGCIGGTKSCILRDKAKKAQPKKPKKYQNEGFNSWSNDGGQTWSNDAIEGFEEEDTVLPTNP